MVPGFTPGGTRMDARFWWPRLRRAGVALLLSLLAPCVAQDAEPLVLANPYTRLQVAVDQGRALGVEMVALPSRVTVGFLLLGGDERWTAECFVRDTRSARAVVFTGFQTAAGVPQAKLDTNSEIRVQLDDASAFPLVTVRTRRSPDPGADEQSDDGGRDVLGLLSVHVPAASVFYRGGFLLPLPSQDPFPRSSASMSSAVDSGWVFDAPLRRCPVPAAGLWAPASGVFLGCEFQASRSSDRSGKGIVVALRDSGVEAELATFGLLVPSPGVSTRFRLIYSTQLPSSASPNPFVLQHIWQTYRERLPAVPESIDLGWLPRRRDFVSDSQTACRLTRPVSRGPDSAEALVLDPDALLPAGSYRLLHNLLAGGDEARQRLLQGDWEDLRAQATRLTVGADECMRWRSPLTGNVLAAAGGEAAATYHSPGTWRIGAGLLAMYSATRDSALLPFIDGVFRWTRACAYTRAGISSQPAAPSVASAWPGAMEFLLPFERLFRGVRSPSREAMVQEALRLGQAAVYRSLVFYTDDPDETDDVDPTFLVPPDGSNAGLTLLDWRDLPDLVCAAAVYAAETGDPLLRYFVSGCLQRLPMGYEHDGLRTVAALDLARAGGDGRPRRLGLLESSERLPAYLQPVGDARLRVLCGARQALAFTAGSRLAVRAYRFVPPANLAFEIAGDARGRFDVNITSYLRSFEGAAVRVNGVRVPAQVVGTQGENLVIRDVTVGDTIAVGDLSPRGAQLQVSAPRAGEPLTRWQDYRLARLPFNAAVDRSWSDPGAWAGLTAGLHFAWGIPFTIGPEPVAAVDLSRGECVINPDGPLGTLFLAVAGGGSAVSCSVTHVDGTVETHECHGGVPALSSSALREWQISLAPVSLRSSAEVREVRIAGDTLLFAVTLHPSIGSPGADALTALMRERREQAASVGTVACGRSAAAALAAALRERVASATRGRLLRVGFLPPYEAYTDVLRSACCALGVMPALLTPEEVVEPGCLTPSRYPIIVYSAPETFVHTVARAGDAAEAMKAYLAAGGTFVVAGHGYPFYYALEPCDTGFSRIKGLHNSQTCQELEIPIKMGATPALAAFPRLGLAPGQRMFAHLPTVLRLDRTVGGGYRLAVKDGLPAADTFTPVMVLTDESGAVHGNVVAVIEHACERYKGGRTVFLWGNVLGLEAGSSIALEFMSHVICSTPLPTHSAVEPRIAVLPRDAAGHDDAIDNACAAVGLAPQRLTPTEFADPAVFNSSNFPIAVHAVDGEYYIEQQDQRANLWQTYADYVHGGGFLIACGTMWQFYYAGTLSGADQWRQKRDADQRVLRALGLRVDGPRMRDSRRMVLRCVAGQGIVSLQSPLPLENLSWGAYRALYPEPILGARITPVAEVVDEQGNTFGGYVMATARCRNGEYGEGEMLWLWGNLLDDARTHRLLTAALQYAYEHRRSGFAREEK